MANVSMTVPTDYSAEQLSIERRRKLAEAMQAQSVQPMESQTAGGWVIPTSHWQGAAKLAQAFGAAYGQNKADESERALASKYRQDLVDTVTNAERARLGTPGSAQPSADLGGGPAQPASPANAQLANALLLNHPATQPMGLQGMQRDMQTQAFIQAGQGGQAATPATPGAPQATQVASIAPTGSVPIGQSPAAPAAPAAQPTGFGGPAGGQPMAAWLATDPSGKAYLEQLAKDHAETQKPLIDRGYGIKVYNPATKKYDLASNPDDITAVEQAKLAATQPFEPPVTLKTSSSQDIQLSRPEYAEYQKSGKLPERYGQQAQGGAPLPKNVPEQDRAAYEAVASGKVPAAYGPMPSASTPAPKSGLGTVGATQTQGDAIQQAGQQRASVEMGEGLGKRYNSIQDAGFSANQKMQKFDRLGGLLSSIDTGKLTPTGTELAAWAKSAGFPISDKVDNAQAAKAMSNEMALELRNPSGGAGMPGAMSDSDRNYLQSLIASIDKTPGANRLLIEGMQKLAQRDREVAQLARDYKKKNGGQFDDGFYDELSKFSDAHPLFKSQSPQAPSGGFTEGQTATGPGGQKVTYRNGQWVPNGR